MNRKIKPVLALALALSSTAGWADEWVSIGDIDWTGPAAKGWKMNTSTPKVGMVCNVDEDDPVTLYADPDDTSDPLKNIYRMAYLKVTTVPEHPVWAKVVGAQRCYDAAGYRVECAEIAVPEAWVKVENLCSWIDY